MRETLLSTFIQNDVRTIVRILNIKYVTATETAVNLDLAGKFIFRIDGPAGYA